MGERLASMMWTEFMWVERSRWSIQSKRHERRKLHLIEDVFLQIIPLRDFDEPQPACRKLKDGTFGHIKHLLTSGEACRAVETNMLNLAHELRLALCLKSAAEDESAGTLSDVHKATDARETIREACDIHAALCIHFHRAEHGDVESAAIIEIEL